MTTTLVQQSEDRDERSPGRLRVVAIGAGLYALSGPGQTTGFSVFVDPITDTLDISRGQLTAVYLVATLLAAPSGLWLGRQLDRRNIGTVIRLAGAGLAIAIAISAASPALWMLTIGIFGLRLFGQTGLTLSSSVFVARTITERRGAALGALSAVGGAAIVLTPLVASRVIPHLGWRETWLLIGVAVALSSIMLARAAERTPLAHDPVPIDSGGACEPSGQTTAEPDRRRRIFGFLVVAAGYAATAGVSTALGFHQIAILGERGLSPGAAAANFLPQSIAAATVAVCTGRIVDRVSGRAVIPACMALLVAALLALRLVDSAPTALLYGLAIGASVAAMSASEGTLLARWVGTRLLGRTRGRLMAIIVASSATAPFALDLLVGATGSFTNAATVAIVLPVSVGIFAAVAPLPQRSNLEPLPPR